MCVIKRSENKKCGSNITKRNIYKNNFTTNLLVFIIYNTIYNHIKHLRHITPPTTLGSASHLTKHFVCFKTLASIYFKGL